MLLCPAPADTRVFLAPRLSILQGDAAIVTLFELGQIDVAQRAPQQTLVHAVPAHDEAVSPTTQWLLMPEHAQHSTVAHTWPKLSHDTSKNNG